MSTPTEYAGPFEQFVAENPYAVLLAIAAGMLALIWGLGALMGLVDRLRGKP